jgi:hypothetical protein
VEIPASFFLPPGGLGSVAARTSGASKSGAASWLDGAVTWGREVLGLPVEHVAQGSDRGATLSLDRLNYLVNKDVGGQRWSIGLNFVPVETESGGTTNELLSVTGNVFFPDGSPPSFVYCTPREDSTGTLEDASSEFRFRCSGASTCGTTAGECAAAAWTPIADDVRLGASFFLPPGGLPPSAQSDPEIFVIGKTSDPPSIVTKDFTIPEGDGFAQVSGGANCPVGATCLADRVGSCTQVSGGAVDIEGFGCGCEIADVPPECITCGGGASGSCGASGGYPVGDRTARGVCLPFSARSGECVVYAVASGGSQDRVVDSCGGPLAASCLAERCCADDPRDGCDGSDGSSSCSGVCVEALGCDGSTSCGACTPTPTPTPNGSCVDLNGTWVGTGRSVGTVTSTGPSGTTIEEVDNMAEASPIVLEQTGCEFTLTIIFSGASGTGRVEGNRVFTDPASFDISQGSCEGTRFSGAGTGLFADGKLTLENPSSYDLTCTSSAGGQTFSSTSSFEGRLIGVFTRQ